MVTQLHTKELTKEYRSAYGHMCRHYFGLPFSQDRIDLIIDDPQMGELWAVIQAGFEGIHGVYNGDNQALKDLVELVLTDFKPSQRIIDRHRKKQSTSELTKELFGDDAVMTMGHESKPDCVAIGAWPKKPGHTCNDEIVGDGFVLTLSLNSTSIAPLEPKDCNWRICNRAMYNRVKRESKNYFEEARYHQFYLIECENEEEYKRLAGRWNKRASRNNEEARYRNYPQDDQTVIVIHNQAKEGGEVMPVDRSEVFRIMKAINNTPEGKHRKGVNGWGRDYAGSKGDGRNNTIKRVFERAKAQIEKAKRFVNVSGDPSVDNMTCKDVISQIPSSTRQQLANWLAHEVANKKRKTVTQKITKELEGVRHVQFWGNSGLRQVASQLDINLNNALMGTIKINAIDAYEHLINSGVTFFTRDGRDTWEAFKQFITDEMKMSDVSDICPQGKTMSEISDISADEEPPPQPTQSPLPLNLAPKGGKSW